MSIMKYFKKQSTSIEQNLHKDKISNKYEKWLNLTNEILQNPSQITSIEQLKIKSPAITNEEIDLLTKLDKKYNTNLVAYLIQKTSPKESNINPKKIKQPYYIQNGWRFTFDGKIIDILLTNKGKVELGAPQEKGTDILDLDRQYLGTILIPYSYETRFINAIYDQVDTQFFQSHFGDDFKLTNDYQINMKELTYISKPSIHN